MPSSRSATDPLDPGKAGFAHRGLHGDSVPENSFAAFEAALAIGAGIECDLRLTADGIPIVFHDRDGMRLCGSALVCSQVNVDDLAPLRLAGTDQGIPSLTDLLDLVGGRTPILLELKSERNEARFAAAVATALRNYDGPVGVMSFASGVGKYLAEHEADIRRGQVFSQRDALPRRLHKLRRAKPDFVAVKVNLLHWPWVHQLREQMPVYSWTVRDRRDRARVRKWADAPIWEGDGRPRT